MAASVPDEVLIQDVTREPGARDRAAGLPELASLGFQVLGVLRTAAANDPVMAIDAVVYVSKYGDALAFQDALDEGVWVRLLSVLGSGRLVETRVPASLPDPDPEAPLGGLLARLARLRFVHALREQRERAALTLRYPDLDVLGMHRQLCDVRDPQSLWVAHRGLLRRVQGADDTVADHRQMPLLLAALHRAEHVHAALELDLQRAAWTLANAGRNLLLVLPAAPALAAGVTWWAAGLLVGFTGACALAMAEAVERPSWRVGLLASPVAVAVAGWLTAFGFLPTLGVLLYALAVVYARDLFLVVPALRLVLRVRGDAPEPQPVPFPAFTHTYGTVREHG